MTKTFNVQVVCRQCFVRTIQMAVAQKRLPLRCILCRAKVLRIKQDHRGKDGMVVQSKDELVHSEALSGLPKSVSGYNIGNYISSSGSNYSFTSGELYSYSKFSLVAETFYKCVIFIVSLLSFGAIVIVLNFLLISPAYICSRWPWNHFYLICIFCLDEVCYSAFRTVSAFGTTLKPTSNKDFLFCEKRMAYMFEQFYNFVFLNQRSQSDKLCF